MRFIVYDLTGILFPALTFLALFEVVGILIEAGVVVFFFRLWRPKMTSLRLVGIVALANIASLFVGYTFALAATNGWL